MSSSLFSYRLPSGWVKAPILTQVQEFVSRPALRQTVTTTYWNTETVTAVKLQSSLTTPSLVVFNKLNTQPPTPALPQHMHAFTHAHTYTHTHPHPPSMDAYTHTYTLKHVHMCTHTHTHKTHTHKQAHRHTHTHTHAVWQTDTYKLQKPNFCLSVTWTHVQAENKSQRENGATQPTKWTQKHIQCQKQGECTHSIHKVAQEEVVPNFTIRESHFCNNHNTGTGFRLFWSLLYSVILCSQADSLHSCHIWFSIASR